jgi:hypothetical protein
MVSLVFHALIAVVRQWWLWDASRCSRRSSTRTLVPDQREVIASTRGVTRDAGETLMSGVGRQFLGHVSTVARERRHGGLGGEVGAHDGEVDFVGAPTESDDRLKRLIRTPQGF